ncbi:D-alanyl-D-alanine carboxypeptidase [Streptomyces sp. NPDC087512]|uniref:D-alanyl-D-alanine carboxypeptidase n=1 Tax=Streptomyces sp. NPDC087512 TaxID=3155059 RepID=UPI003438A965
MEEASVAGESPDRSKQRESSEEPTSGSAGPVPEARTEVSEARDPRLAVARDASKPSASARSSEDAGSASARGGVDTATRVFSASPAGSGTADVKEAEEAARSEESEKPGTGVAGDKAAPEGDAASRESGAESASGTSGEGRLREAVAAWVATADERAAANAGADDENEDEDDAPEDAAAGKARKAGEAEDASDEDAQGAQDAAQGSENAGDAGDADDDAGTTADAAGTGTDEPGGDTEDDDAETGTGKPAVQDAKARDAKAGKPAPEDAKAGDGDEPAAKDADDASGDEDEERADPSPVDQPTAVFKAVRPSAPAVDQPTTMLKLGGGALDAAKKAAEGSGDDGSNKADEPEADAERTSKFVALKPLDDPAGRKPARPEAEKPKAPAAGATTALPRIRTGVTENYSHVGPERTTQQPLPPKPPLDLLAELTNTPPPPETPLRTTVRRVKIWTPLVLLLVIVIGIVQAMRPLPAPELDLTAQESFTFDGDKLQLPWPGEGQGWIDADGVGTMGNFGEQKPVAIGSVAKTMTAYIILRDHPLKPGQEGPKIEIDATAEKEGGYNKDGESTLDTVKAGGFLTEKQALSAVMIPSANNIARLLARWDAGSEAAFVEKMNATAKELGMTDTHYTDPSGLKETTVSTAEDQVKLGRAVVKDPAMVAITSAASWTDPSGRYWTNYNELPYRIGAIGIKTGSTTAAGGNLLFASRKEVDGQTVTVVGAILGQHKPKILETVNAVSKTALLAAEDALTSAKILKKGDVVGYVDDQLGGRTPVVVTKDVSAVGWAGLKVKLSLTSGSVPHTAKAGTKVGTLTVGDGGVSGAVKVPVALQQDLVEPALTDKLTRIG